MKTLFVIIFLFMGGMLKAQETTNHKNVHHIVFQMSTADTLAHKALVKQLKNITSVAPSTIIEVICHGPGLSMLEKNKSTVADKIMGFPQQHAIKFLACEFSMQERKVALENLVPTVGFVPSGIIAIVQRQEDGWSYIKAGF